MIGSDERRAPRISCEIPVRILTDLESVTGTILDVSRTGVRFSIPGPTLGLHRLSGLVEVAKRLTAILGDTFVGELHFETLGSRVRKTLRTVRVGQQDRRSGNVEIGCVLEPDLDDEEAGLLGIRLPPAEAPDGDAQPGRAVELVSELSGAAAEHLRDLRVCVRGSGRAEPFEASLEAVTMDTAALRIEAPRAIDAFAQCDTAPSLVLALDQDYGPDVQIEIRDAERRRVWSGCVHLLAVEMPPMLGGQALLHVAFERTLRLGEQRALQIA